MLINNSTSEVVIWLGLEERAWAFDIGQVNSGNSWGRSGSDDPGSGEVFAKLITSDRLQRNGGWKGVSGIIWVGYYRREEEVGVRVGDTLRGTVFEEYYIIVEAPCCSARVKKLGTSQINYKFMDMKI